MSLMNPQPPLNVGIDSVNTLEEQGPEEDKWITLKVSANALRTINKKGISAVLAEAKANGNTLI